MAPCSWEVIINSCPCWWSILAPQTKMLVGTLLIALAWRPFRETLSFRKIARTHLLENQTCNKLTVAIWICFHRSSLIWGELTYWVGQKFESVYGKTSWPAQYFFFFFLNLMLLYPFNQKGRAFIWVKLFVGNFSIVSDLQFWDNCVIQVLTPFLLMGK